MRGAEETRREVSPGPFRHAVVPSAGIGASDESFVELGGWKHMKLQLAIKVTSDDVQLSSEADGQIKMDRNLTVIGLRRGSGLWIGGPEEPLEPGSDFSEVLSFDPGDFDVKLSASALLFYTEWGIAAAHRESLPATELADQVEVRLDFPGYERVPFDRRREFEYRVLDGLLIDRLSVNGREAGWPRQTRQLARWLAIGVMLAGWGTALSTAFPATFRLIVGPGSSTLATSAGSATDLPAILFAVGGLAVVWAVLYVAVSAAVFATWLVLSRFLLPPSLRAAATRWMLWPGIPMRLRVSAAPLTDQP